MSMWINQRCWWLFLWLPSQRNEESVWYYQSGTVGRKGMAMDLIPILYLPTQTRTTCLGGWLQYSYLSGFHPICLVCLFLAGPCSQAAWGQERESRSPGWKSQGATLCPSFSFLLPFHLYFPQSHLSSLSLYCPLLPPPFSLPLAALHLSFPSSQVNNPIGSPNWPTKCAKREKLGWDIQIRTQAEFYAQVPDVVITSSVHHDNYNCSSWVPWKHLPHSSLISWGVYTLGLDTRRPLSC